SGGTRASRRSRIVVSNGSSRVFIRCSSGKGWDPISSTDLKDAVTMEPRRNARLAEIARDAALERSDFLVRAGEQLERFMAANLERIREIGGVVLIDDDPDYLAVAPDGSFRSRSRIF